MQELMYGTKELYDFTLKASFPMEINGKKYEKGEPILSFKSIQVINFDEVESKIAARGGKHNKARVIWEDTHEIPINFRQGIFSKTQFGILTNTLMIPQGTAKYELSQVQELESDDTGTVTLAHEPLSAPIFIYNAQGDKLADYTVEGAQITNLPPYTDLSINYSYLYEDPYQTYVIGSKFFNGFMNAEARMRLKDDTTGKNITGIIKLYRVKLMSDLSFMLGQDLPPMSAQFSMAAYPGDMPGDSDIGTITWLSTDIDE